MHIFLFHALLYKKSYLNRISNFEVTLIFVIILNYKAIRYVLIKIFVFLFVSVKLFHIRNKNLFSVRSNAHDFCKTSVFTVKCYKKNDFDM